MEVERLISRIREGRVKDLALKSQLSASFDVLPADTNHFWAQLFKEGFIDTQHEVPSSMMMILSLDRPSDSELDIFRKHSTTRPIPKIGGSEYNWAATVYLNFVLQYLTYNLVIALCFKNPQTTKMKLFKRLDQTVYASPSRRQMDGKGAQDVMTYPEIFFTIDNFDDVFEDVVVQTSHNICVELVASVGSIRSPVFSGAVTHTALASSYNARKPGRSLTSIRTAQKKRMEFLQMQGPHGLGSAEMAVSIANDDDAEGRGTEKGGKEEATPPSTPPAEKPKSLLKRISGNTMGAITSAMSSFHLSSHSADAQTSNLHAFLTFVSLPIESIVSSLLDKPGKPIFPPPGVKSSTSSLASPIPIPSQTPPAQPNEGSTS